MVITFKHFTSVLLVSAFTLIRWVLRLFYWRSKYRYHSSIHSKSRLVAYIPPTFQWVGFTLRFIKQALSVYFFHHQTVIEDSTAPFYDTLVSEYQKIFTHPKFSTIKIIPLKPTFSIPLPSYYTVKKYLIPPTPSNIFPKHTTGGN